MSQQEQKLVERLNEVIGAAEYRHAFWGIGVADGATGEILYNLNGDKLFPPASTTKLWSCAAALDAYGPDYRFITPVVRRGEINPEGVVDGELILRAVGDPALSGRIDSDGSLAFTSHDHTYADFFDAELTETDPLDGIDDLARQIAASGVRQAKDLLIDDRLFDREAGEFGRLVRSSPVMVNDNLVDILITPAESIGMPAGIQARPATAYVQIDCQVETVQAGEGGEVRVERLSPRNFAVKGKIEIGRKPLVKVAWIEEPQDFTRTLLVERLRRYGVRVDRSLLLPADYAALPPVEQVEGLPVLARHISAPFSEVIRLVLKVSHNPIANVLPQLVAVRNGKRKSQEGLRRQAEFLQELGIDPGSVSFGSGAGGSLSDHVTPMATLKLLQGMANRRDAAVYKRALPVMGVDGTLSDAVGQDSPARGKVLAKTGTALVENSLDGSVLLVSKALAGYLTTASGRQLNVVLFLSMVPLPSAGAVMEQGKVLGKICEILVQTVL